MNKILKSFAFSSLMFLSTLGFAEPIKVVFINPGYADQGFWKAVTDTMTAAASQLNFELDVRYGNREWLEMVRQAEAVIASKEKPDYLILVNEHQQGAKLLQLADSQGIPTLMLLNTLTQEQRTEYGEPRGKLQSWIGSLTPDNEVAGFEMATSLVDAVSDKGGADEISLLTLAGDTRTPASLMRLQGLDRALASFPTLKEKRRLSVNWSFDEAYKRTKLWFESGESIDAIWAANDPIALGAAKAVIEKGLVPGRDVMISGLNWSPEAVEQVRQGRMTLTHGGHFLAGAWAMVLLYDHANGKDYAQISPEIDFPMTAINRSNAARYQSAFGDQQWTKVDFQRFSRSANSDLSEYEFTLERLLDSLK